MVVAVFRAHRTEIGLGEQDLTALKQMEDLATKAPGYVSHKAYVAQDGERLTLFEWESIETLRAGAAHPEHVLTKALGRERFYEDYHLQVCEVLRESRFTREAGTAP